MKTYNAVAAFNYRTTGRTYSINTNNVSKDQLHKIVRDQLGLTTGTMTNKINEYFDQVEDLNSGELVQVTLTGPTKQLTLTCWT